MQKLNNRIINKYCTKLFICKTEKIVSCISESVPHHDTMYSVHIVCMCILSIDCYSDVKHRK